MLQVFCRRHVKHQPRRFLAAVVAGVTKAGRLIEGTRDQGLESTSLPPSLPSAVGKERHTRTYVLVQGSFYQHSLLLLRRCRRRQPVWYHLQGSGRGEKRKSRKYVIGLKIQ